MHFNFCEKDQNLPNFELFCVAIAFSISYFNDFVNEIVSQYIIHNKTAFFKFRKRMLTTSYKMMSQKTLRKRGTLNSGPSLERRQRS